MNGGWQQAKSILAIRLDAMGDVLMTGPAIRALKQSLPGRQVTLLTSPAGASAASLLPEIDEILVFDAPWMKATAPRISSQPDHEFIRMLARRQFDAAVIFTVYSQNPLPAAFLCHLADIPLRLAHCRENPYQLLTDWVREVEPENVVRHEVRRQLDLVAQIGCRLDNEAMCVKVPEEASAHIRQVLRWLELEDDRSWAVVHPGASAPSRRYPAALFAQACRMLVEEHEVRLVFTGDESERLMVDEIRERIPVPSDCLAGELNLGEMAALLACAPVLVSNNTGPVHLASSVGCPVVDLYALTNPQHTPWMVPNRVLNHDVPCRWCYKSICPQGHHLCLNGVEPSAVVAATLQLLSDKELRASRTALPMCNR